MNLHEIPNRIGYRFFKCDKCTKRFWLLTRDRFSPSLETCACGDDVWPSSSLSLEEAANNLNTQTTMNEMETVQEATYQPNPVDLSNVELPEGVNELVETMAEHNHDVWAQSKIAKGYRFGAVTSDANMTHADLIPYGDLTEDKKQYDRDTSLGALKLITSLGYKIEKV